MIRPIRLFLSVTIALAAIGVVVGRNMPPSSDEAVLHDAIAGGDVSAEPFPLRGAWRDIGRLREAMPAASGSAVETLDTPSAESPKLGAAVSAGELPDGRTIGTFDDHARQTQAGASRPQDPASEEPKEALSAAEVQIDRNLEARERATLPAAVSDEATSALPERTSARLLSRTEAAAPMIASRAAPARSQRRGDSRPRSAELPHDGLLATSLFRDMHYATP